MGKRLRKSLFLYLLITKGNIIKQRNVFISVR